MMVLGIICDFASFRGGGGRGSVANTGFVIHDGVGNYM